MARGGGSGGESKRSSTSSTNNSSTSMNTSSGASSLPLRYAPAAPTRQQHQQYGATYQSLETAASGMMHDDPPPIRFGGASSSDSGSGNGGRLFGRRLLAPAGLLLHGGALVAVGLLCGLGVGVLIGRGAATAGGGGSAGLMMGGGAAAAGLPVLGNAFSPQDVEAHFTAFHFTDTHLEPLYDKDQVVKGSCRNPDCCKKGKNLCEAFTYSDLEPPTLGCDPPVSLLEGTMEVMRAMDPGARYVFYTGDMPAHHLCTEELVRRTQQEFLSRVTKGLPPTMTFVYAIGNNDLWPNNKNSAHNFEALYDLMAAHCPETCAIFQGTPEEVESNKKLFREGGYYVFRDPATKLRTLVLNSGLWSPRYDNADLPRAMPEQHMAWARRQLQAARDGGEKVVIISHIPPGHVRQSEDWAENYLDTYIALCTEYTDVILAQFYGHHSKEYIRSFSPEVGVLVSAGLTPLGGGSLVFPGKDAANPSFRHAVFTKDAFYDMWSFYLDLSSGERGKVFKAEGPGAAPGEEDQGWKGKKTKGKKKKGHHRQQHHRLYDERFDVGGGGVFPSNKRKDGDRAVYLHGVLQHQPGLSSRFLAAVQTANAKGWDLLYSFKETYRVPDVSAKSISVAAQRILHDSHYTSRYESYLSGLHSPHRMITCDVHTRTPDSEEVEACVAALCAYDVSQECADFESRRRK